jgi:hypothetical protein
MVEKMGGFGLFGVVFKGRLTKLLAVAIFSVSTIVPLKGFLR